jgi:hypothetical protein
MAYSIALAISERFPLITLSIASNRFRVNLPIFPFVVRSRSDSSAESEEYVEA